MAEATFHRVDYLDPKIFLSLLTWAVYLLLVYTAGTQGGAAARRPIWPLEHLSSPS